MTEETHKKLNRWLETVEKCLSIGVMLFGIMTASPPVTNDIPQAGYMQHQAQS